MIFKFFISHRLRNYKKNYPSLQTLKGFPKAANSHINGLRKAAGLENLSWIFNNICDFQKPAHGVIRGFSGVYGIFWYKNDIYPPPLFRKWYFFPSRDTFLFYSYSALLVLILPYAFILLPTFSFSFPFLLFFFYIFSFFLPCFIFFPTNHIGWYPPPQRWGVFSKIQNPEAFIKVVALAASFSFSTRRIWAFETDGFQQINQANQ